ncbi:hypothetical protein GCM10018790_75210 [Kitasatospora xanthocidica]|nr:hypothetical protein GCM10018790_75210 [Kitasatospora xanthocidica]
MRPSQARGESRPSQRSGGGQTRPRQTEQPGEPHHGDQVPRDPFTAADRGSPALRGNSIPEELDRKLLRKMEQRFAIRIFPQTPLA